MQSARAMVQLQTVRLSQTQVRAPDAGVISARQATVGSVVGAGTELFRFCHYRKIRIWCRTRAGNIALLQRAEKAGLLPVFAGRRLQPQRGVFTQNETTARQTGQNLNSALILSARP